MVNVNNSSNTATNAVGVVEKSVKSMDRNSIRSQSLLEIGGSQKSGSRSSSHPPNLRSYSSSGLIGVHGNDIISNSTESRRKNTLTKMKGLVIPESETSSSTDTPATISKTSLSTPPWKQSTESNNFPKYSPAFKRKPFSVFGQSTPATTEQQQNGGSKNTPNDNTVKDHSNITYNQKGWVARVG